MGEIRRLQLEHKAWMHYNFPDQDPIDGLLGMVEEIGELAHAVLKHKQNIRSIDVTTFREMQEDAVADTFIFMMSYCNSNDIDLEDCILKTWAKVQQRDWQVNPEDAHELNDAEAAAEEATWD